MAEKKPQLTSVAEEIAGILGFRVINFEGKGSFKETYGVINQEGEPRALKITDTEKCAPARTEREISTLLQCECPLIGKLYDYNTFLSSSGTKYYYTVEEFLGGGTLSRKIAEKSLSPEVIRGYAISLVKAIDYLKGLNVVHRDIKPDNIMFRSDSIVPVLVDLGILRDLSKTSLTPTWVHQGPGTPYYSAPEQLNNDKNLIDWRTDQFSLGIVIGICLTGRHPFQSEGMSDVDTVGVVMERGLCDSRFISSVKELGFGNIARMLNPWPIQRFQSTGALLESFQREV
jgi:serine/threonine protein kinase